MVQSVSRLLQSGDYPGAIREYITTMYGSNKWSDYTVYEQNRMIQHAQIYCDNYMIQLTQDRLYMEHEFR